MQLGQPGYQALAYGFNGSSSYISVPSSPDLDPGNADVTITIHMKSTTCPTPSQDEDWDLIRKGVYATSPGEYKMEYYPDGQALCGFKGVRADGTTGYGEAKGGPALERRPVAHHPVRQDRHPGQDVVDGTTVASKPSNRLHLQHRRDHPSAPTARPPSSSTGSSTRPASGSGSPHRRLGP